QPLPCQADSKTEDRDGIRLILDQGREDVAVDLRKRCDMRCHSADLLGLGRRDRRVEGLVELAERRDVGVKRRWCRAHVPMKRYSTASRRSACACVPKW